METACSLTIPVFIRQLKNLSAIILKAEEWCSKHAKPQSEIIQARLHQTMPTLPYQVLVCTNMARNSLLGPDWTYLTSNSKLDEDFDSLQARITDTVEALSSYDEEIFKAHIDKPVSFWPSGKPGVGKVFEFRDGITYLKQFAIPDFWFHVSMTYAICRMKGVPLGKLDWLTGGGDFE